MKKTIFFCFSLLLLTACTSLDLGKHNDSSQNNKQQATETFMSTPEVITTRLNIPWTIAKNEEVIYLTQREGKLIEISFPGEKKSQHLTLLRPILHEGEGGLLGLVLAPDFEHSGHAFAYYTYKDNGKIFNRVVLLEKNNDQWTEKAALLENIPGGRIHNGGRLKIGPDQKLYITTGDAGTPELSQDIDSLAGKILRINLDGTFPKDNPFKNSLIYSYGHRNPQGLTWDDNGQLYSTEHGQSAHDEINLIKPGENYGWPIIQGDETKEGMTQPLYHTDKTTWAPSGIDYHGGKLYIATLRDSRVRSFDLKTKTVEIVYEGSGRMRDVYIENTQMYTITNNRDGRGTPTEDDDRLLKLELENQ